jgi:hypothetical protein
VIPARIRFIFARIWADSRFIERETKTRPSKLFKFEGQASKKLRESQLPEIGFVEKIDVIALRFAGVEMNRNVRKLKGFREKDGGIP